MFQNAACFHSLSGSKTASLSARLLEAKVMLPVVESSFASHILLLISRSVYPGMILFAIEINKI